MYYDAEFWLSRPLCNIVHTQVIVVGDEVHWAYSCLDHQDRRIELGKVDSRWVLSSGMELQYDQAHQAFTVGVTSGL